MEPYKEMEESESIVSHNTTVLRPLIIMSIAIIVLIVAVIIMSCSILFCIVKSRNNQNTEENWFSRLCDVVGGWKPSFNLTDRRISEQLNL